MQSFRSCLIGCLGPTSPFWPNLTLQDGEIPDLYSPRLLHGVRLGVCFGAYFINRAVARYELLTVGKPVHLEERLVCINNESLWKRGCELYGGLVTKYETSLERVCRLGLCVGAGVSTA